jgi:hypothetical protein
LLFAIFGCDVTGAHVRRQQKPVTLRRVWLPCFLLFGFIMVLYALASPLASGADEATSIVRAVAAARGQLVGTPVSKGTPDPLVRTQVKIPFTFYHLDDCYAMHPIESAECETARPVSSSRVVGSVDTLVGHYPPLYYLIVGLPSYLPGGRAPVYLMRFAGIAVNAALLALAVYAIRKWARSQAVLLGFAFAASPMVLFFSSVINPSGMELCGAICLWTTATIWAVDHPREPPSGLLWTVTISAAVLIQARPASPAWPVLIALVLVPLLWKKRPWQYLSAKLGEIRARRELWPMLATVGVSGALAVLWLLVVHSFRMVGGNFPPPGTSELELAKMSIDYMPRYLQQSVGVLGWLDTAMPTTLVLFWFLGVLALLAFGLVMSKMRGRLAIFFVMLFSFLVPTVGTLVDVHSHGFSSQGRYFLPLFVGLPIVAAALAGRALRDRHIRPHPILGRSIVRIGVAAVGAAQVVAFGVNLRRYLVGIHGPLLPWSSSHDAWRPPLPGVLLDVLALAAIGLLYWRLGRPLGADETLVAPPPDSSQLLSSNGPQ